MTSLLRWLLPSPTPASSSRPHFRPRLQTLDARLTPAVSFAAQQAFAVGTNPSGVTVGDVNGDGRADLITANTGADTLSVLLNTTASGAATPTFGTQQPFATGDGPSGVAVGDFNGDGRPDLASANNSGNSVSVLLNKTLAGTLDFSAPQTFAAGTSAVAVAVADFNGDGRPDLAVSNYLADTVSVLLSTTPVGGALASFAAQQTFAVGQRPYSVAAADFNADGRADLLTANYLGDSATVLLNTAAVGATTPAFAATALAVADGTTGVGVADFNGDGRADFATADYEAGTASVALNTTAAGATTPTFGTAPAFAIGALPYLVVAADFDGDGRADLAAANSGGGTVSVLVNTTAAGAATPAFAAQQTFAVGSGPLSVAAADFNGDGRPDLASANSGSGSASVLLNTSTDVAVTGPVLVGQFGTTGVWRFNRATNAWTRLTASNANALAAAPNGNLVASFPGFGVYHYRPTGGWVRIHGSAATVVAIDPLGNAYAGFAGFGTHVYRLATGAWTRLTTQVADKLAASANGDVIANFGNSGVHRYRPTTGWVSLATPTATALAVGENGDIAATLGAFGVYRFKAGTWTLLNSNPATAVAIGANGTVAASFGNFGNYGVAKYIPFANGWQSLHSGTPVPTVAMDLYGNVFATLGGFGVYEHNPHAGWRARRNVAASFFTLG